MLLAVYEALNPIRQEIYVGTTELQLARLIELFKTAPPAPVAHWKPGDGVMFCFLAYALAPEAAKAQVKRYAPSSGASGWKVLRDG